MRRNALVCSTAPLEKELGGTVLWSRDVDRRVAHDAAEALSMAQEAEPNLVVVDRNLPAAAPLVSALRGSPRTRAASIVVVARGDFDPVEAELVASGANAVLRFPPDLEWDQRLLRLMTVPVRRNVRLPISLEVEGPDAIDTASSLGTALNLSANGMLLESECGLKLGTVLELAFRLPGFDPPIVDRGKVMRLSGQGRFGVEFLSLRGDGEDIIRCFVGATGAPPAGS